MSPPKAIVFDLGKVLLDFDYSIAARRIAAKASYQGDLFQFFTIHSELLLQYETGLVTSAEFFAAICGATGFTGSYEEFASYFGDIFSEIPPMVSFHARARKAGFRTFIFSNTNEMAIEHIRRNFPFFSQFNGYIYSYEVRSMKPDRKIYEAMEALAESRGDEILYIDDRPENVEGGLRQGWRSILHVSPQSTVAQAANFGVEM
jgi:putative hydrolase of the HAD superfamily